MTTNGPEIDTGGRPTPGAVVGYVVFGAGTLLGIGLASRAWDPRSDENPLVVLVMVWVISGLAHIFVRSYWKACALAAAGSALGYVVFAFALTANPLANEMFGAGIIELGLFGFVASMIMGIPVVIHRRMVRARGPTA